MHGPQQVYRAETIACALAFELAKPGDDIILDNQSVVKATPIKRKGVVKDQDYRDIGYLNSSSKRLTIRWTPGHRTLEQATTYKDYQDIQGNSSQDKSCPRLPRHGSCKCVDKNEHQRYTG